MVAEDNRRRHIMEGTAAERWKRVEDLLQSALQAGG